MTELARTLHEKAISIAKRFHEAESILIDVLGEIDTKRVFVRLGYSSLFDYAIKALKLSEANASNFIAVARKSRSVPELKRAIERGDITVSKARKITPVLTQANHPHWLELAKTLPKPKLEREVARVMPQAVTQDRARYVTGSRLELRLGVSEETMTKFRRAQDLVSQKTKSAASFEQTLEALVDHFIKQNDPVAKAQRLERKAQEAEVTRTRVNRTEIKRAESNGAQIEPEKIQIQYPKSEQKSQQRYEKRIGAAHPNLDAHASVPGTHSSGMPLSVESQSPPSQSPAARNSISRWPEKPRYETRAPLRASIKNAVHARDQGQCTHRDSAGLRCTSRRWIQIHHKIPVALGGLDEPGNLQTLCSNHHCLQHL